MANSRYTSSGGGSPGQSLLIDVRASTQGFAQDLAAMRGSFDGTLVSGFTTAGNVLENALTGAVKKGNAGFLDLQATATKVINEIAAQAVRGLFSSLGGAGGATGLGGLLGGLFGLPGRATGGPVSPGQPYVVGENGPELFVPTAAGAIAANPGGSAPQDVRVAITINTPAGADAPAALQRSSRQVAAAVRRALAPY
ncbi:MAG: tail tape measure protein [Proteobacteria bacterium]|nr:tail tape measure protein [Pseudomonadota bacterium]